MVFANELEELLGAAVSAKAVKPRRSQKRQVMYTRCPARSCSPRSLDRSSATCGDTKRESSVRCRSTALLEAGIRDGDRRLVGKVWTSWICSSVYGPGSSRTISSTPINSSSKRTERQVPLGSRPWAGIRVLGVQLHIGHVHDLPRDGRATRPRRTVERVRMALVVLQLVDTADAGHGEKDVAVREVQHGVSAGAGPHCRRRHLVEHGLQLCRTNDCAKHAADRVLLLAQSLVAPGELLDFESLGAFISRTLRRSSAGALSACRSRPQTRVARMRECSGVPRARTTSRVPSRLYRPLGPSGDSWSRW